MCPSIASERGSTGSAETSRFHSFSAGNTGQPAIWGPGGVACGAGGPASGGPASGPARDSVDAPPWGPLLPHATTRAIVRQRESLTAFTVGSLPVSGPGRPSQDRADERLHCGERLLWFFAVRRVSAPFEQGG